MVALRTDTISLIGSMMQVMNEVVDVEGVIVDHLNEGACVDEAEIQFG